MNKAGYLGVVSVLLILAGCGGGGGDSPSNAGTASPNTTNIDITGTWKGTGTSTTFSGTNTISLTFTQTGSSVSGTFACSPGTLACLHANATIAGMVNGQTFTGTVLYPDNHSCSAFNGNLSGTTLSGNYTCEDTVTDTGSWTVTKQ